MKATDFAQLLTQYLSKYLPGQRNLSPHTIRSYRDTFKLLLTYCLQEKGIAAQTLTMDMLDVCLIRGFLQWLEEVRGCCIATRNQRLAALHAFFQYAQIEKPERILFCQQIMSIPFKKCGKGLVNYLNVDVLKRILSQPDSSKKQGRRDRALLVVLYDTAARVQELVDLVVSDIRLESPSVILLHGKGNKQRQVPLMGKTSQLLSDYLSERRLNQPGKESHPVFFNSRFQPMTRAGIAYILKKYVDMARKVNGNGIPKYVSPHVFRHTKAMHLLQANVNLIYIRDFLGHVDVSTTEIYARVDSEVKRKVLEKAYMQVVDEERSSWIEDEDLVSWLQKVCRS